MKKILFFAALGALGTAMFTSCSNDDIVNPQKPAEVTAAEYAAAFKAKFGNSDFNTVKAVDVTAQIPEGTGNYTLRVYDGYPSPNCGTQMIGKYENLRAGATITKKVNCPGNAERLFFTVEKNGLSKVSNCLVKNNKVVAKFDNATDDYTESLQGTFKLNWSDQYAQFSKAFYDALPTALTSVTGLFNETEDHRDSGADATFAFNAEGKVVFYPIFMNELLNDKVGYFIYNNETKEVIKRGILINGTQNTVVLQEGTETGPNAEYPKIQDTQGVTFLEGNNYMYSRPYTVEVPAEFTGDVSKLVVGITISNNQYNQQGESYSGINNDTYYSMSELNKTNSSGENVQVAVYASGEIEIVNETESGIETTTGTFGLVGIEDNINEEGNYASDWDMNDIVLYTEATQVTTIEYEQDAKYFVAFEDLGGTWDFDFNDVVLEIDYVSGMESALVKCVAAGGTLPVSVMYDPEERLLFGGEIHAAFDVPTTTVVNTIPRGQNINGLASATKEPLIDEVSVEEDFIIAPDALPFSIFVDQATGSTFNQVRINARGEDGTPQALVIGTTWTKYPDTVVETPNGVTVEEGQNVTNPEFDSWRWPIECIAVDEAYPGITEWIQTPTNLDWLKTGVADKLY